MPLDTTHYEGQSPTFMVSVPHMLTLNFIMRQIQARVPCRGYLYISYWPVLLERVKVMKDKRN